MAYDDYLSTLVIPPHLSKIYTLRELDKFHVTRLAELKRKCQLIITYTAKKIEYTLHKSGKWWSDERRDTNVRRVNALELKRRIEVVESYR